MWTPYWLKKPLFLSFWARSEWAVTYFPYPSIQNLKSLIFVCSCITYPDLPIITVATYSGRTQTEKDRLAEAITDDVVKIWKVKKEEVIVVFQEASHGNWYASGVRL